ncbi:hypothetical protein GVK83_13155 [Enterococcus hirae]|uniref:hypothetical protein n=1 Tax=Enterococcus hirae TaxID=1354 RepID=UPI001372E964|nr:hypothetical protein [Enterococcus hirae]NBA28534.1 hypothetical protein [Enterococcus hirae]NBA37716.1 hypothetical protein [Enterococcus hirae]
MRNISTSFKYNEEDARLISIIMTTQAEKKLQVFQEVADKLSDYAYWFLLSTMWVKSSDYAPISSWKKFFSEKRLNKAISLMKPDELTAFKNLPSKLTAYRAHSKDENDWISYTLDLKTAIEFAERKKVNEIMEYKIKKHDCLALFLRRGETEIICLDKSLAKKKRVIIVNEEVLEV